MPAQLHFDGFYATGPIPWEDWHAGVRMHGTHFHYSRYYPSGEWLRCCRDNSFDFWSFSESVTSRLLADAKRDRAPRIGDADPLCTAGSYTIVGDILSVDFSPESAGGMAWQWQYLILDDRLVGKSSNVSKGVWLFHPKPLHLAHGDL